MKSTNAKQTMELLRVAQRALRHSWEDLKNDSDVREKAIHERLQKAEKIVLEAQIDLVALGYKISGKGV